MEWVLKLKWRILPIRHSPVWIGRDRSCRIWIRSSKVSRFHGALVLEAGQLFVHDDQSRNGTFVNGDRVAGMRPLQAGDRLRIGPVTFRVEQRPGAEVSSHPLEDAAGEMLLAMEGEED